ncbi:hypothetical protein [Streptomyces boncukensis]|uniref:Uncharacterized protein n=1 Tax=Streptomyces boncukensis TaxID=2711219 RepID=A0A6G4X0R3_9ACTN|nr:hypothetical protein [Streptomyces boncukensis]NGO71139.1 hypothetical protein [Streptomyces boncukensis]
MSESRSTEKEDISGVKERIESAEKSIADLEKTTYNIKHEEGRAKGEIAGVVGQIAGLDSGLRLASLDFSVLNFVVGKLQERRANRREEAAQRLPEQLRRDISGAGLRLDVAELKIRNSAVRISDVEQRVRRSSRRTNQLERDLVQFRRRLNTRVDVVERRIAGMRAGVRATPGARTANVGNTSGFQDTANQINRVEARVNALVAALG